MPFVVLKRKYIDPLQLKLIKELSEMRVRGNQMPSGAFNIHPQPDKVGFVCIRFFENAHKVKVVIDGGDPVEFAEYDEYELIVADEEGLVADIEANFDEWLLAAKSHSPEAIAEAAHAAVVADLRQAVQILAGVDLAGIEALSLEAVGEAPFTAFAESVRARGLS